MADFRKKLTDRLVEHMEEHDGLPWQKGWESVNLRPFNPKGAIYKGGNVLNLIYGAVERNSDDPRWMTLKQANTVGCSVRKGAKSELVEYWDWGQNKTKPKVGDDGNEVEADEEEEIKRRKPKVFYAVVFNGADIKGLPDIKRELKWEPNEIAEKLIAATGAVIEHRALSKPMRGLPKANAAYFDLPGDKVVVPPRENFKSESDYYATVVHELAHWTGGPSRLARLKPGIEFGSPDYAKEELRAEIASMFLNSALGLEGNVQNHARYTAHWLEALKGDKHEIFRAAKEAERIVDYLFEFAPELKAIVDQRFEENIVTERSRKLESGISPDLPNFVPADVAKAPAREGRDDPRWVVFERAVMSEADKYHVAPEMIGKALEMLEPQFSAVMNAAEKNGYTVEDMNNMLVRQLVEEMRTENDRQNQWEGYCQKVRAVAVGVLSVEQVETGLQALAQRYQQVVQHAAERDLDNAQTDTEIRNLIYGEKGRRAITPEYVRETFGPTAKVAEKIDDGDIVIRPTGRGFTFDSVPVDAVPVPDEAIRSRHDDGPSP